MDFYSRMFKRCIVYTGDLQDPAFMAEMRAQGFVWLRPHHRPFDRALRNPIIGSYVELLVLEDVGCVYIDSPAARRIIRRVCPGPL